MASIIEREQATWVIPGQFSAHSIEYHVDLTSFSRNAGLPQDEQIYALNRSALELVVRLVFSSSEGIMLWTEDLPICI